MANLPAPMGYRYRFSCALNYSIPIFVESSDAARDRLIIKSLIKSDSSDCDNKRFKEIEKMEIESRIYKYFPYSSIREPQKKIIPDTYTFIRIVDYDGMILSAASGVGKEACMTSQALLSLEDNLFDRVIFAIITDIGRENILKELRGVEHDKKVMKVFSKEILCNWMKETEDERISAIEEKGCAYYLCKLQGHKCRYKDNGCDYQFQGEKIKSADILICDYNYIISPFIRRASGFEDMLQNNRILLLIDECHMLKKRAEMIVSNSISSTTIIRAIQELEKYECKEEKEFVENILIFMKKEASKNYKTLKSQMKKNYEGLGETVLQSHTIQEFLSFNSGYNNGGYNNGGYNNGGYNNGGYNNGGYNNGGYNNGSQHNNIEDNIKNIENIEDIEDIIKNIENAGEMLISTGEKISDLKFERKEGIVSYAEMVGNFISRFGRILRNKKENSNVFFLKLKNDDTIYIGWIPLDVRGFLRNAITRADKYILYSGTVKPIRLKNDVGLTNERIYIPDSIESPYLINRKDIILTKERFCFKNIKDESFSSRIIGDLDKLFPNMERPIGIVCTNLLYENLGLSSKYDILNEPKKQEDVEDWLKVYVPKAQLIRFGPYGRIGQSIDLSHLKSIIFLGLPYPKVGPIMQEKINKLSKNLKGKTGNRRAQATYMLLIEPAYERIVQSAMRGLRNENDRLFVIYYDVNYKLNKPSLGSKNLVVCDTISEVISHLEK